VEGNILIVDDEPEIAELAGLYLENEGYTVFKCGTAADAMRVVSESEIDLALLDVMLPDMDGFFLCHQIRDKHRFPIIMLTAKIENTDKITGLSMGADDYITKPFNPLEMVARVKAQLRRYKSYNAAAPANPEETIDIRNLHIEKSTHECTINEKPLVLTPIEFSILWLLCENAGHVVNSERLFQQVWGEKYFTSSNNTVTVHIRHLREKIKEASSSEIIKTVWGVGYKIEK
jgi:two-component system response regulator VanR